MKQLRYLIFLLFNLSYKDGNYDESQTPYFNGVLVIMIFQYFILLISFFSIDKFIGVSEYFKFIHPKLIIVFFFIPLAFMNYYFFVKKKYFDRVYIEFKDAPINTRRNRRVGYVCLILYWVFILIVIGNLKSWLS